MSRKPPPLTHQQITSALVRYNSRRLGKTAIYRKGWFEIRNNGETDTFLADIYRYDKFLALITRVEAGA